MSDLIHLIYSSVATVPFSTKELHKLLDKSRSNNHAVNVTGMLLFDQGSFFQVLEGEAEDVDTIFHKIEKDPRHEKVVTIIREPIHTRSFEEWTMGYADITTSDISNIVGLNNFFSEGTTFGGIGPGRAKKLLEAFREGRWHNKVSNSNTPPQRVPSTYSESDNISVLDNITIGFQPLISAQSGDLLAYEALACDAKSRRVMSDEELLPLLKQKECADDFYLRSIKEAAKQDTSLSYALNFFENDIQRAETSMKKILAEIENNGMHPSQFIVQIHQSHMMVSPEAFGAILQKYRAHGIRFLINHFGAGRAGLNLLEPYRPDLIALNKYLVIGVQSNGPRQAIVRGLLQTCMDLGIDVVAKFVEDTDEYEWLKGVGVDYIQGDLFGVPMIDKLTLPSIGHV